MPANSTLAHPTDETCQQFEQAWREGRPLSIEQCLPPQDHPKYVATLEKLAEIEMELAWRRTRLQAGSDPTTLPQPPRVEEYVARFPVLNASDRLSCLIRQEYRIRHTYGDRPSAEEYRERFPQVQLDSMELANKPCDAEPKGAPNTVEPGQSPAEQHIDRYVLRGEQGRGGFGIVWRAIDPKLGRQIAVKQLSGSLASDETNRRRFINEARISARLEHPGVVPIHDIGPLADSQSPFYTMKLVAGETLAEAIDRFHAADGRSREDRALEHLRLLGAFVAVVKTMEYAHAQKVIHRDLKPRNIILGHYGETVILDWGLAKALEEDNSPADTIVAQALSDSQETLHGTVQGTPAYMSPEQAAGRTTEVDQRSDIYSLGVILYQLLTGRVPFEGRTNSEILRKSQEEQPPRPRLLKPAIPKPLEAICLRCLAKPPGARYGDVGQLRQDLERYLADEPVSTYREPPAAQLGRWARRHRTVVAAGTVACLLLSAIAVAGFFLWEREQQRRQDEVQRMLRETHELRTAAIGHGESALAELRADRFASGRASLRHALASLDQKEGFDDLRVALAARLVQVQHLADFDQLANEAEKLGFLEYDDLALARCEEALQHLGVFQHPQDWWLHLPTADLTRQQTESLQRDAHRQLLLLAALRCKVGVIAMGPAGDRLCQKALVDLPLIHAFEQAKTGHDSYTGRLLENGLRLKLGQELKDSPNWEPDTAADFYFLGIAYFWIKWVPDNDPVKFVLNWFGPKVGHDFKNSSAKSDSFLRAAAALEPKHYWAHFWLGWSVQAGRGPSELAKERTLAKERALEDFRKAELAFNTCIAVRPDFSFAYAERAKVLLQEAHQTTDVKERESLRQRAIRDLDQAARYGADEPDVLSSLANGWAALNERGKLLEACAGILDLQAPLESFRQRRNFAEKQETLRVVQIYVAKLAEMQPEAASIAILAHAALSLGNHDEALRQAERALTLTAQHPRALVVRGLVHLRRGELTQAISDLRQAQAEEPGSFLALAGMARAHELCEHVEKALSGYDQLLSAAKTHWQRAEAHLGRARVLTKLRRLEEAGEASKQAQPYLYLADKPTSYLFDKP